MAYVINIGVSLDILLSYYVPAASRLLPLWVLSIKECWHSIEQAAMLSGRPYVIWCGYPCCRMGAVSCDLTVASSIQHSTVPRNFRLLLLMKRTLKR